MGEIVNLKRARKQRERLAKEAKAAENRAKYGRTKAAREAADALAGKAARALEGHRLDTAGHPVGHPDDVD